MEDNGYTAWITGLIAEAENYVPPTRAAQPATAAEAPLPATKPRIRPTIVTQGPNTYATYTGKDGLASFVTVDGPGWKL